MSMFDRFSKRRAEARSADVERSVQWPFSLGDGFSAYGGLQGLNARPIDGKYEVTQTDLDQMVAQVYKANGPVAALVAFRMSRFSEARFCWQKMNDGRPGDRHWTSALEILENPAPHWTRQQMLKRAEQDASLMGNSFITNYRRTGDNRPERLRRLRPDWTYQVWGSYYEPDLNGDAIDSELIGHVYLPRQAGAYGDAQGTVLLPEEVAWYAPIPDPQSYGRGMSWLTPVIREVFADQSALEHKESFFKHGAVSRLAIKVDSSIQKEDFERLVELMNDAHSGSWNAYKTIYIGGGADPIPMTFSMKDIDFHAITGAGETRLASAARVPPTLVGFSEGMQGSALNAGNYQQTRREYADGELRPMWGDFVSSLATLVTPPDDTSRLWYDDRDIAYLRDDSADAAKISSQRATTIRTLVDAGFEPDAAIAAAETGDFTVLKSKHTGLFSVQLQPPGNGEMQGAPKPEGVPKPPDTTKQPEPPAEGEDA